MLKHVQKHVTFCVIFQFLTMFNTIVRAGAVRAGSRYGSSSDQKMRLHAAPAPQHCLRGLDPTKNVLV
jgi:hypothetical protein